MHVMVVDDDPWIADLLKQIVLSVRPGIQVDCFRDVGSALVAWSQASYALVLADWNLPDASGIDLLRKIRQFDKEIPLVMITGRADRDSVKAVIPLGISAFITKPFEIAHVAQRIEKLLPTTAFVSTASITPRSLCDFMQALTDDDLDLPMLTTVREKLELGYQGESLDLRELTDEWQRDSALCAHLITVSNSPAYMGRGSQCVGLNDALRRLGARTSVNLAIGFALKQTCTHGNLLVSVLLQDHIDRASRLAERVAELAGQCGVDSEPLQTAALLHRMGESCVIYQTLKWESQGNVLDETFLTQAIARYAAPFANRLKSRWGMPRVLRELIGAVYALPQAHVRRDQVVMRLAAAINGNEPSATVDRLKRLAGIA